MAKVQGAAIPAGRKLTIEISAERCSDRFSREVRPAQETC
jgi:hypothetical protein